VDKLFVIDILEYLHILSILSLPPCRDLQHLLKNVNKLCCTPYLLVTALQLLAEHFALVVGVVDNIGNKVILCDDLERAKFINLLPEIAVLLPRQKMRSHSEV